MENLREEKNWIIREAVPEDTDAIYEIEKLVYSLPWSHESISKWIHGESRFYLVALDSKTDKIVGYLAFFSVADQGEIASVAVDTDYRRCGIASMLFNRLKTYCDSLCLQNLYLEVRQSNIAAISLYRSVGFEKNGIRNAYYTDTKENAVLMVLSGRGWQI